MTKIITTVNVDTNEVVKTIQIGIGEVVRLIRETTPESDGQPLRLSWQVGWGDTKPFIEDIDSEDGVMIITTIAIGDAIALCDYNGIRTKYIITVV